MKRLVGMARFIRLDHLHRELMYVGWDQLELVNLQRLRDEVAAEWQKYLDDPNYAKAEEAAYGDT